VPDHRYTLMINGVPVVEASEEVDICNAEQLRIVLLEASTRATLRPLTRAGPRQ